MGTGGIAILKWVVVIGVMLFIARLLIGVHLSIPGLPLASPFGTSTFSAPTWHTEPVPSVFPQSSPSPTNRNSSGNSFSQADIPNGFTASQLSPYFHQIRLGSVIPGSSFSYGQVTLFTNLPAGHEVDITGWVLQANRGSQVVPKAVDLYDPSGLSGESDIRVSSGDYVNMYSIQSAIGENLRMNKCIGYLQNDNNFTPQLPLTCPYVNRSDITNLTGACQNVILSIGSCKLPPDNPLIQPTDYACKDYLSRINYKGCFDAHSGDADFLSHEWRVWTGARFLDPSHDTVYLYDRLGLLVDSYSY